MQQGNGRKIILYFFLIPVLAEVAWVLHLGVGMQGLLLVLIVVSAVVIIRRGH